MEDSITTNSATRGSIWIILGAEALDTITELRWLVILIFILVGVDMYYGIRDSYRKYKAALKARNMIDAEKYKVSVSRALRRTTNKFCDYFLLLIVGCAIGIAILEPWGVCTRVIAAGVGVTIGIAAELFSIFGHYFALHGITATKKSIRNLLERIVISVVKVFSPKGGTVAEEVVNEVEKQIENNEISCVAHTDNTETNEHE